MMHGGHGGHMAPMAAVNNDDVTARKLFVRGLSWETETAQLLEAVCHVRTHSFHSQILTAYSGLCKILHTELLPL